MFLQILFTPIVFIIIYVFPLIGVVFSQKDNRRWLAHWLITIFVFNIVTPLLSNFIQTWIIQFFIITLGTVRLLTFNNDKSMGLFGLIDSGVQIINNQIQFAKQRVQSFLKQYGLLD